MKTRSGFVSNSSSSSFIIVSKKGSLTKEALLNMFDVPKTSLMYPIAKDFARILMDNSEKTTLKQLLSDYCAENIEDLSEMHQKALKSGGTIYTGSVSNESDDGLEIGLVDMALNFEDENIVVQKEAGY